MAVNTNVFTEKETNNWFKAYIALNVTKEGLTNFVESELRQVHVAVGRSCGNCCIENLLPCPTQGLCKKRKRNNCTFHQSLLHQHCQTCDQVRQNIISLHRFNGPSWLNTKAERWATDSWEIGKCYLPPDGYRRVSAVTESDLNGVISVMLNCRHFETCLSASLSPPPPDPQCLLEKVRQIGRAVRHTANCKITDADLQDYFHTLSTLLADPKCLIHDPSATIARTKLSDLQNDRMSLNELGELLKDANQTLKHAKEAGKEFSEEAERTLVEAVKTIEEKSQEAENKLTEVTQDCIQQAGTDKAKEYYERGLEVSLPRKNTRDHLRDICQNYGHKSQELISTCEDICKTIRAFEDVVDVYPAFHDDNRTQVVFVVLHTGELINNTIESKFKGEEKIDYVAKAIDCFGSSTYTEAESGDLRKEDEERLQRCILVNSKRLFAEHQFLTFIQGVYSKKNEDKDFEPRLAFYVPAKGYVPIEENPFHQSYEGISVIVREGAFVPFGKHANDIHDQVLMGCRIERKLSGTLGVFLQHPMFDICGITCAHVLLDNDEMDTCKGKVRLTDDVPDYIVYQPTPPHDIGKIREVIINEGTKERPGIEIAVIQLLTRIPDSGRFPASRGTSDNGLEFTSGNIFDQTNYTGKCFKFGSESDYTEGTILDNLPNAVAIRMKNWRERMVMYNQVQVRQLNNNRFAKEGDSGGPVFVGDCDGKFACIGIIEGGVAETGLTIVMPIRSILQEIGINKLKSFSLEPEAF